MQQLEGTSISVSKMYFLFPPDLQMLKHFKNNLALNFLGRHHTAFCHHNMYFQYQVRVIAITSRFPTTHTVLQSKEFFASAVLFI